MSVEAWEHTFLLDEDTAHVRTVEIYQGTYGSAQIDLDDLRAILREAGYVQVDPDG